MVDPRRRGAHRPCVLYPPHTATKPRLPSSSEASVHFASALSPTPLSPSREGSLLSSPRARFAAPVGRAVCRQPTPAPCLSPQRGRPRCCFPAGLGLGTRRYAIRPTALWMQLRAWPPQGSSVHPRRWCPFGASSRVAWMPSVFVCRSFFCSLGHAGPVPPEEEEERRCVTLPRVWQRHRACLVQKRARVVQTWRCPGFTLSCVRALQRRLAIAPPPPPTHTHTCTLASTSLRLHPPVAAGADDEEKLALAMADDISGRPISPVTTPGLEAPDAWGNSQKKNPLYRSSITSTSSMAGQEPVRRTHTHIL